MAFHYFFNSLVVFFILSGIGELILFAFRIKNSRVRIFIRALPFIKFPFDFLIFGVFEENLFLNFNPFGCKIFFQHLLERVFGVYFKTNLSEKEHWIIPHFLTAQIPAPWLKVLVVSFGTVSLSAFFYRVLQYCKSYQTLKKILRVAIPCTREIKNSKLLAGVKRQKAIVVTSNQVNIPLVASRRHIIFPQESISQFSQEEFEAVLAHELEHLYWKDSLLKLYCTFVHAFFWWVPSGWWLNRIEVDMEIASDKGVRRYGIAAHSLASAIVKVIALRTSSTQYYSTTGFSLACELASSRKPIVYRFKSLLEDDFIPSKFLFWNSFFCTCVALISFISFWSC